MTPWSWFNYIRRQNLPVKSNYFSSCPKHFKTILEMSWKQFLWVSLFSVLYNSIILSYLLFFKFLWFKWCDNLWNLVTFCISFTEMLQKHCRCALPASHRVMLWECKSLSVRTSNPVFWRKVRQTWLFWEKKVTIFTHLSMKMFIFCPMIARTRHIMISRG